MCFQKDSCQASPWGDSEFGGPERQWETKKVLYMAWHCCGLSVGSPHWLLCLNVVSSWQCGSVVEPLKAGEAGGESQGRTLSCSSDTSQIALFSAY